MSKTPVTVRKTSGRGMANLKSALERVRGSQVLVGIPSDKAIRPGGGMNNASLLFVLSKGSPLNNLPPRPVLEPAIEKSKALIAPELAAAAEAYMDGNPSGAKLHLNRAGMIASNAAKRYITEGNLAPNAPSTIAHKGSDKPLIDTGQLRRAIVYVVKEGNVPTPERSEVPEIESGEAESAEGTSLGGTEEAATIGGEAAAALL